MSTVADRLGLFQTLASAGPLTCGEFAARADIDPRYALERLSAMACHGYIAYDDTTKRFTLPPEHAFCLANHDSPFYLGSLFAMAQPYWAHVDLLADAFRHGGGVPQADCREMPSESGCTLTIAGEEEEVVRAATEHAVSVHGHQDTPELRTQIRAMLKNEAVVPA